MRGPMRRIFLSEDGDKVALGALVTAQAIHEQLVEDGKSENVPERTMPPVGLPERGMIIGRNCAKVYREFELRQPVRLELHDV